MRRRASRASRPRPRARPSTCALTGRRGIHPASSACSTRWVAAPETARPMSTSSTDPASSRPGGKRSPGLRAANVTVRSAVSTWPAAAPVRPSTPLGMSTARTGGRVRRRPFAAEPRAERGVDDQVRGGQRRRLRVDDNDLRFSRREGGVLRRPSLPLFPLPAITTTRPYVPPSSRTAARATAAPARSTSTSTGSGAAASIARISSGVTTGSTDVRYPGVGAVSFDRIADRYDETRGGLDRGRWLAGEIGAHPQPGSVLEIGIGTGAIALPLTERGRRVVGVDVSSGMLARARERLGEVVVPTATTCRSGRASVDNVLPVWVLQLVPDLAGPSPSEAGAAPRRSRHRCGLRDDRPRGRDRRDPASDARSAAATA